MSTSHRATCCLLLAALVLSGDQLQAQDTASLSKQLKAAEAAKDWPLVDRLAEQMAVAGNRRLALLYILDVAEAYRDQGYLDYAEGRSKRALQLCEQAGRPADLLPMCAKNLGSIHLKKENFPEALRMYQWALNTYEAKNRESDDVALTLSYLGDVHTNAKHYSKAEPYYLRALAMSEKLHGKQDLKVAWRRYDLGWMYRKQRNWKQATAQYEIVLAIRKRLLPAGDVKIATSLEDLATAYEELQRYAEAETLLRQALAIREKANDPGVTDTLLDLASILSKLKRSKESRELYSTVLQRLLKSAAKNDVRVASDLRRAGYHFSIEDRHSEAEELFRRSLAICRIVQGENHRDTIKTEMALGDALLRQGKHAPAEELLTPTLNKAVKAFGVDDLRVGEIHQTRGIVRCCRGRFAEAEVDFEQSIRIKERRDPAQLPGVLIHLGGLYSLQSRFSLAEETLNRAMQLCRQQPDYTASMLSDYQVALADVYQSQGRYEQATQMAQAALTSTESEYRPDHPIVAQRLLTLGLGYLNTDRLAEAEAVLKRASTIQEQAFGGDSMRAQPALTLLGSLYASQGRFVEAEWFARRALIITEKTFGPNHCDVGNRLWSLGCIVSRQERMSEAEKAFQRAIELHRPVYGETHQNLAGLHENLGWVYFHGEKLDQAEAEWKKALAITDQLFGNSHFHSASLQQAMGALRFKQKRFAEAEEALTSALQLNEKTLGREHSSVANCLVEVARLHREMKRFPEAEAAIERALVITGRTSASFGARANRYALRAQIAWDQGRKSEGMADLREALRLAEQQRGNFGGAESDRSKAFAGYAELFERMVEWQTELGDVGEAIQAIELGRARSLLDEMGLAGADIDAGRSILEREQIQRQEQELRERIAGLELQIAKDGDVSSKLAGELAQAREQLYQHYRDTRSSNPTYRSLLSVGAGPPRLSQLQKQLVREDGLLLMYMFGKQAGYVVAVDAVDAQVLPLKLSEEAALALHSQPGPLSAEKLHEILIGAKGEGLAPQLASTKGMQNPGPALATLWKVLVPTRHREALLSGKVKRLLISPDGPLALLPFEALIVTPGEPPVYLLDAGPPIVYGPSATVFFNLATRESSAAVGPEPVLSMGDPRYRAPGGPTPEPSSIASGIDAPTLAARSGKRLAPLPHSGIETNWVAEAFASGNVGCKKLLDSAATEANLRSLSPGRRILHLACHGITDQNHGNFFGALALTPVAEGGSSNDGYLTLPEIYSLKLKGCELAILSACETNYGPQQRGEGSWALSRGFLVAGAKRVVGSNWLVDDEAAAHLVNAFCTHLAAAEKDGRAPTYAEALRDAKRWIRSQEKWKSPYYWGSFVLVGPN